MSKYQWISVLGLWVIIFLFLGFPAGWDEGIAIVSGLIIILLAYRGGVAERKQETPVAEHAQSASSTFVENKEII